MNPYKRNKTPEDLYDKVYGFNKDTMSDHRARDSAAVISMMPYVIGIVFGLAIARLLGLSGAAYPVLAGLGAIGLGTFESVMGGEKNVVAALFKNMLAVGSVVLVFCILKAVLS